MVDRCAENEVSSTNWGITSDVACCGYKKKTGIINVLCVGSSRSKCGAKGFSEPSGFGMRMRFRS